MYREAFEETLFAPSGLLLCGSRNKLWRKGEEQGMSRNSAACTICFAIGSILLLKVWERGSAVLRATEGFASCFFRKVDGDQLQVIGERVFDPKVVYKK